MITPSAAPRRRTSPARPRNWPAICNSARKMPGPESASPKPTIWPIPTQAEDATAAANEADAILERDPRNSQAATLRAMALYGQARQGCFKGKPEVVGTSLQTALSFEPSNREVAITLARIYRAEPRYLRGIARTWRAAERERAADQIIDRLVAASPRQAEVFLVRYRYRMQYRLPGAADDLKEAQRLGLENPAVLLASAEALRGEAAAVTPSREAANTVRSLREAACARYQKAANVAPGDYRGYLGLGETLLELGRTEAAMDAWEHGLQSAPGAAGLFHMLLAKGLVSIGHFAEAEKYLDRLAREIDTPAPDQNSSARALLARRYKLVRAAWWRGKNQPFTAIALARAAASGSAATAEEQGLAMAAWELVADANLSLGRWSEAAEAYEKVVDLSPRSPRYRAMAAAAWMEANQPERARRSLQLALAFGDGPELRLALTAAVFRQNMMAAGDKRDWQSVQTALDNARLAHAKQPLTQPWRLALLEAEITEARADAEGRHADGVRQAAAIYRNIQFNAKEQSTVLPAIAMAFDRLDLHDDADRTIAAWEKTVTPWQSRMVRAQLAVQRKQYDEARRLVQTGDDLSAAERSQSQRFLVQLSLMQRDWRQARVELDSLQDFGPRDLDLLFAYAELAGQQRQSAEVERCLRTFAEMEGMDSRYGLFLRAAGILNQVKSPGSAQLQDAQELVDRLIAQCPEWSSGLLLRCRLLEIKGRGDEAIKAYAEAIRHGAAGIGPYERLIDLLSRAGRNAEARECLQALLQNPPADRLAAYADFLLRHGSLEDADAQIRRLERLSADEPAVLALRVRWLQARRRDGEIAPLVEAAAERRGKTLPASSEERGRHCKTIGALYELVQQYVAAERWYRRLLDIQPDSFEPLAAVLAKQKRGAAAVAICVAAAKRSNSSGAATAVCTMRATCLIEDKDLRAAESVILTAEKARPEPAFLTMLAAVRVLQDKADEAISLYQRALAAEPQDVRTMNNLATLLGEQPGRIKDSLALIDRAWLLETKGQILLRDGRVDSAIAMLQEASTSAEPDPRALLHLAQAYRLAGKLAESRRAFEGARKRNLLQEVLTPADRALIRELDQDGFNSVGAAAGAIP